MIIQSIQAENVLRYAQLRLTNLPQRGLIGISGPNESGKTTIAEIICLALFGRSFSLDATEIAKNIKWGAFSGSVTVAFTGRDGQAYHVVRQFDVDGNHTAQLHRGEEEAPLARGVAAVQQSVTHLGGFTYERFIDSFYLAQRNIAAPHILTATVKALAGVDTLEHIAAECEQDAHTLQTTLASLESQLTEARRQRTDLNIQTALLPALKTERHMQAQTIAQYETENPQRQATMEALRTATAQVGAGVHAIGHDGVDTSFAQWQQHAEQLGQAVQAMDAVSQTTEPRATAQFTEALHTWLDDLHSRFDAFAAVCERTAAYQQHLLWLLGDGEKPEGLPAAARPLPERQAQLRRQESTAVSRRVGVAVAFLAALLLAACAWGTLWFTTYPPAQGLGRWLVTALHLRSEHIPILFAVAAGLSVAGLVFFVWLLVLVAQMHNARQGGALLRHQQEEARSTVQRLDALPSQSLPAAVASLRQCDDTQLADAVALFATGPGAALLEAEAVSAYVVPLQATFQSCQEQVNTIQAQLESASRQASTALGKAQQEVDRLDEEIATEEARLQKAAQLDRQVTALQEQIDEHTRQIDIRRIAQQLLTGTHSRLFGRFNLEMRHVVSKIMPLLTDGRYETLQVDKNLDMQVFSNEKANFVGLNEISGGTYNQVMLAVRLALSQALIASALCRAEFIILDEPFAFFDEQRTRRTLATLPKVSNEIDQIWIITQQFADANGLTLHLRCALEDDVLIASGT